MESRALMMLFVLLTLTVVVLGSWRESTLSRDCARQGGSYSVLERRCNPAKHQPRVIIQRDLLRT